MHDIIVNVDGYESVCVCVCEQENVGFTLEQVEKLSDKEICQLVLCI